MKLGIIGAGYVGLTTGVCLASLNHSIIIHDINKEKIQQINNKKMPFFENGLQELLEAGIENKKLTSTTEIEHLIRNTDGCFVCVGTPTNDDNSINIEFVINAINTIAENIKKENKKKYLIIIRSTIIPGTTKNKIYPILKNKLTSEQFDLCVTPEFLREGNALNDFMNPDKIVIGGFEETSINKIEEIFKNFKMNTEILKTNTESAELIKYTNNAFFSMLISFANEIANISEKIENVDASQVLDALVKDKRISKKIENKLIIPELSTYLIPGCGFGGSCFPKDVKAIIDFSNKNDIDTPILNGIIKTNDGRIEHISKMVKTILKDLKNKKISILGLTFKPDTDDLRSSPSLLIIEKLKNQGANIHAYDPIISKQNNSNLDNMITISKTLEESIIDSELIILLTKWDEFKKITENKLETYMKNPQIMDCRNFLKKQDFKNIPYYKIGLIKNDRM